MSSNQSSYSTYSVSELLNRWARGELNAEQTIGHLLQNLLTLSQRLVEAERRLRELEPAAGASCAGGETREEL